MKNQIILFYSLFFYAQTLSGQKIEDVIFRKYVKQNCYSCIDDNGNLLPAAKTITQLKITYISEGFENTKGLEGFSNLKEIVFDLSTIYPVVFKFDSLPPQLEIFNITGHSIYIQKFPQTLKKLRLSFLNDTSETISELPIGLKELELGTKISDNFKFLPKLSDSLEILILNINSENFKVLPKLPNSLKSIALSIRSKNFKLPSELPNNLNRLDLFGMVGLLNIPTLPNSLQTLFISDCDSISQMPVFPSRIKSLHLNGLKKLKNIPLFPDSLDFLDISICPLLTQLPPLPLKLDYFGINSTGVACLPFLPNKLTRLNTDALCIPNIPLSLYQVITPTQKWKICKPDNPNNCQFAANIYGKVFFDSNNDKIQNIDEPNARNVFITSSDGQLSTFTDSLGKFILLGDSLKTYTFSPILPISIFKIVPTSITITTPSSRGQSNENQDFAIQNGTTTNDLSVNINPGFARPGFKSVSTVTYRNIGTSVLKGTISLTIDDKQNFISSNIPPKNIGNKIIEWDFSDLRPFEYRNIKITLGVSPSAVLNTFVQDSVKGSLSNLIDNNEINNNETINILVRGSYDPNDIQVNKTQIPTTNKVVAIPLEYLIRFQNTGNAEAIRVEVIDTISKKLDISALEMIGYSHNYEMKLVPDSGKVRNFNIVKWTFDDINLLDSTSNEKESHGFLRYRIKNDPTKMPFLNDSILNKVAIYFDFNPPVVTNTAKTVFKNTVGTKESNKMNISVYPNPTNGQLTIQFDKYNIKDKVEMSLINVNGQIILQKRLDGYEQQLDIQNFQTGVYFLRVTSLNSINVIKVVKL